MIIENFLELETIFPKFSDHRSCPTNFHNKQIRNLYPTFRVLSVKERLYCIFKTNIIDDHLDCVVFASTMDKNRTLKLCVAFIFWQINPKFVWANILKTITTNRLSWLLLI